MTEIEILLSELDSLKAFMFKQELSEDEILAGFLRSRNEHKSVNPIDEDLNQFTLEHYIAFNRKIMLGKCEENIRFIEEWYTYFGDLYHFDPFNLKFKEDDFFRFNVSKYLSSVLVLNIYSYDLNAYVSNQNTPIIKISRAIMDAMGAVIAPAFVNLVFDFENQNIKMKSDEEIFKNINLFSEIVCKSVSYWAFGYLPPYSAKAEGMFKYTEANYFSCRMLADAMTDFVLLHEYAHTMLGHHWNYKAYKSEIEADNLALNVLLASSHKQANQEARSFIFVLRAVAPVILFYTFRCLETLLRKERSSTHPESYWRANYLTFISKERFKDSQEYYFYAALVNATYKVFEVVFELFGVKHLDFKTQFDIGVDEIDFRVMNCHGMMRKYRHRVNRM